MRRKATHFRIVGNDVAFQAIRICPLFTKKKSRGYSYLSSLTALANIRHHLPQRINVGNSVSPASAQASLLEKIRKKRVPCINYVLFKNPVFKKFVLHPPVSHSSPTRRIIYCNYITCSISNSQ